MPKRNDLEYESLHIIVNSGEKGILQCNLWRQLDASSREGSRIALKLWKKGLIDREKELHEGRWTFRLYPKRKPISIESIEDCPCFACVEIDRCVIGGSVSPITCEKMNEWLGVLTVKSDEDEAAAQPS